MVLYAVGVATFALTLCCIMMIVVRILYNVLRIVQCM